MTASAETTGSSHWKKVAVLAILLLLYGALIVPFARYMREKPYVEKLGLTPKSEMVQALSADQKQLVGATLMLKILMYFGGLIETAPKGELKIPADYMAMSRLIHTVVKLDPYNMDAYYFAQAVLVWDVRQFKLANELLEYGMKYRTWDWYLPFFASFNYAYFLKDYANAAKYAMRVGELTDNSLYVNLSGRYLHEAGQTELALKYLSTMLRQEKNDSIKEIYKVRYKALAGARVIELARDRFRAEKGRLPASVQELQQAGYLPRVPVDPYGGEYFLQQDGKVDSTSKFAFATLKNKQEQNQKK